MNGKGMKFNVRKGGRKIIEPKPEKKESPERPEQKKPKNNK